MKDEAKLQLLPNRWVVNGTAASLAVPRVVNRVAFLVLLHDDRGSIDGPRNFHRKSRRQFAFRIHVE